MGYVLGVSVGQKSDHSAIVIAEYPHRSQSGWVYLSSMESEDVEEREAWRWPRPPIAGDDWALNIVHVERWLRGTPYPTIVADVDRLSRAITLDGRIRAHLLVDSTGGLRRKPLTMYALLFGQRSGFMGGCGRLSVGV